MKWCIPKEVERSIEGVRWICSQCGKPSSGFDLEEHFPQRIFRPCSVEPTVVDKGWSFAKAHARWIAAGQPKRSLELVAEIFTTICQPCEHFQPNGPTNGTCKLCGCRLKQAGGMLNKIAMATEDCPAGKWPPIVS